MSDEDLLLKGVVADANSAIPAETSGANGRSGIATPMDIITVSVFGVYPDDTAVEAPVKMQVPRHTPGVDVAARALGQFIAQGGILMVGEAGEVNFYPLNVFKRLTAKVGIVAGVTL